MIIHSIWLHNHSILQIPIFWSDKCCKQARCFKTEFAWCALIYNFGSQQEVEEDDAEVRTSGSFHLLAHHPEDILVI
jgi:hypothetical protein